MTVRQTSREALSALYTYGTLGAQQQTLIGVMLDHGEPVTRLQLSKLSNVPINAVAGRVNELIKEGVVVELEKAVCPISKRKAMLIALTI